MIKNPLTDDIWNSEPDFVNEIGTKWWLDLDTTKYCTSKGLKYIKAWFIETSESERLRVLTNTKNVIYESTSWESVLIWIDALKFIDGMDE